MSLSKILLGTTLLGACLIARSAWCADAEPLLTVSLAFDVQPLFDSYCVSCHLLESPQGGLVLEAGEARANLVEVPSTQVPMMRVTPGDTGASYLIHKLRGTFARVGGSGQSMPYGSEVAGGLGAANLELIERWVRQGAPDN